MTIAAVLILLIALSVWLGNGWGSVAELLGGIATVGTLAAAVWVAEREVAARRADTDERERRQASQVSCWLERAEAGVAHHEDGTRSVEGRWTVIVSNGSDQPVYRVGVWEPSRSPTKHPTSRFPATFWPVVRPRRDERDTFHLELGRGVETLAGAAITFIDARGIGGVRDHDGVLVRHPDIDGMAAEPYLWEGC